MATPEKSIVPSESPGSSSVFLSYSPENEDFVADIATRLKGDARLGFWFRPWHSVPGVDIQDQMEEALEEARVCAVFFRDPAELKEWSREVMRAAISKRVEDQSGFRVMPVLLPGTTPPNKKDMPRFLRLYEPVEFKSADDERAFKRLTAGILGIPPIQIDDYLEARRGEEKRPLPPSTNFEHGHALVIGVAKYPKVRPLPESVLSDARDLYTLLTDQNKAGYIPDNVKLLLDGEATREAICSELAALAERTGPEDTAVVFFSGHGAHDPAGGDTRQYLIPFDGDPDDLVGTAIIGEEMTNMLHNIKAGRLVVLFDSCHSGGAADAKGALKGVKQGLSEDYYALLGQGNGRVVIASSRPDEESYVLRDMRNSLFTHYLLEALQGKAKTLGDGFVRVFDVFRHISEGVPPRVAQLPGNPGQHPIFKAAMMEDDFPIAIAVA